MPPRSIRETLAVSRRSEPCRARRHLNFSEDENDRVVPSFWDPED
jgi:hypothetical protein